MKRLLERIGATLGADDKSDAAAGFPSRPNRMWSDQSELWGGVPARATTPATTVAPRGSRREFDFSATEIVRVRPKTPEALRTPGGGVAYAERRRGLNAQNIARFLEVNQTVQTDRGFAYRVIQAVRGVSADYDLWKGPTKRVTFLLG